MKNWEGTREEVEQNGFNGVHTAKGKCVALTHNNEFAKEDALLITDALNTVNKCGLMPSELLKQRDEAVKLIKEHTENGTGYTISQDDINPMLNFLSKIQIEQ